jgi:DNA-binding transcriptional ArsR family regulator
MRPRRISSAKLFAALGDETRLGLIARLCAKGPLSIRELTVGTRVTRQAITKHLRLMERSGLAQCQRQGRESLWQIDRRRVQDAQRCLDQISVQWDKALMRLQAMLDEGEEAR